MRTSLEKSLFPHAVEHSFIAQTSDTNKYGLKMKATHYPIIFSLSFFSLNKTYLQDDFYWNYRIMIKVIFYIYFIQKVFFKKMRKGLRMKIPGSITKPVKPVYLVYIHGLYPCNYLSEANHRFPRTLYFYFSVF